MMNPDYHFDKMRALLGEFEPSRERSLAQTKIDEAELWLTRCVPTREAIDRDGTPRTPRSAPELSALLGRAVRELADSGSPGQNALGAELARDGGIEP